MDEVSRNAEVLTHCGLLSRWRRLRPVFVSQQSALLVLTSGLICHGGVAAVNCLIALLLQRPFMIR